MKSLLSLLTLFSTIAFPAHLNYLGISGAFVFTEYETVGVGSVTYDKISNKGDFDLSLEYGYKQVPRGNSWLETSRVYGVTVSHLFNIVRPLYIGPCCGIVRTEHYTYNPDFNLIPSRVEDIISTSFIGAKSALLLGNRSRVKFKMQARVLCGVSVESVFTTDGSMMGHSYQDVLRLSIIPAISAGIMVGI